MHQVSDYSVKDLYLRLTAVSRRHRECSYDYSLLPAVKRRVVSSTIGALFISTDPIESAPIHMLSKLIQRIEGTQRSKKISLRIVLEGSMIYRPYSTIVSFTGRRAWIALGYHVISVKFFIHEEFFSLSL